MVLDRLDDRAAIADQMYRYARATDWLETDEHRQVFVNPRPRRAIPIWVGGFSEPAFRRGGRLGDGYTFAGDVDAAIEGLARVRHHLAEAGRSADGFGCELIPTRARSVADVVAAAERWEAAGGTAVAAVTMKLGFDTAAAHVDYAAEVIAALT